MGENRDERLLNFNSPEESKEKAPIFTAPKESKERAPIFNVPEGSKERAPVFTEQEGSKERAPVFTESEGSKERAPVFTGSEGSKEKAPTFTAPRESQDRFNTLNNGNAPIFQTSNYQNNSSVGSNYNQQQPRIMCAYHINNAAVMRCPQCGRPICAECKSNGELSNGSYVCYDCASMMVQNDVELAKRKRLRVLLRIIVGIVGAIICGILSFTEGYTIFWTDSMDGYSLFIGRSLLTLFGASIGIYFPVLKKILSLIWKFIRWNPFYLDNIVTETIFYTFKFFVVAFGFFGFVMIFSLFFEFSPAVACVLGIVDFIRYRKANDLVQRNQEILQRLADRMEYIRIRSEENMTNESLVNDERMQNNQFAQAVRREGYSGASKSFAEQAKEMADNDRKIKKFVLNENGEAVRVA